MRYDGGHHDSRWLGSALALAPVMFASVFAQSTKSVWSGVYTSEQATRGGDLYRSKCAECHGDDLEGREQRAGAGGRRRSGSVGMARR